MIGILVTVFVVSIAGSLHCVGMCGPFALMCASRRSPEGAETGSLLGSMIAFNGGRLLMYTAAGAVSGGLGLLVNFGGSLAGWQRAAAWIAGGSMIVIGAIRLAGLKPRWPMGWPLPALSRWLQRGLARFKRLPRLIRAGAIGALTSLMPCGWLYVFVFAAGGTGSPVWGALVMIAFWLGTLPALGGLMLGGAWVAPRIVRRIPTVMAAAMVALGVYTIAGRATVQLRAEDFPSDARATLAHVDQVDPHSLPCCGGASGEE
jgi:sulfite exporter TauE/SafE